MHFHLRFTSAQREILWRHLFPGDGSESIALAVCGLRTSADRTILCVYKIHPVPIESCIERTPIRVKWDVSAALPVINEAIKRKAGILKIHSHPTGLKAFSSYDDISDRDFFAAVSRMTDDQVPGYSAVMLEDGSIRGRVVGGDGTFVAVDRIMAVGDEIELSDLAADSEAHDDASLRTRQAFGEKTVELLKRLRIGLVGCSGTGSWIAEMLARYEVGELVLVDPDAVERKNLNRIINSVSRDAEDRISKVEVIAHAIAEIGLGTKVRTFQNEIESQSVVEELGACDMLFGCLDSSDGRDCLNRISTFYLIPYFDVGIRLDADGHGGITQICAAIHYLIPGGSSLLSRSVITPEQVAAEAMRRTDPRQYESLLKEGYIHGVTVDRPAVCSVNGFAATHAVNEMLARIHPYRTDPNGEFRYQLFSLRDGAWLRIPDGGPCLLLSPKAGRGDSVPLLDSPALS